MRPDLALESNPSAALMPKKFSSQLTFEICILTGGLSQRMGRDKARLRLGNQTMLGHIRATAKATGLPVRTISRDLVPRCGPLGGIFTALKTTRADAVLFLACDMPFVSTELLELLLEKFSPKPSALFTVANRQVGFPFVIPANNLSVIEKQIERNEFSLHKLAAALHAKKIKLLSRFKTQLQNINTPADLKSARENVARRPRRLRRKK